MADTLGVIEPVKQVLMAPMKWATRVLQWAGQDKPALCSDRISATEFLKVESRVIVDQTCYGEVNIISVD